MKELVIIRGIPGSGKSTIAAKLFPGHVLCEADQFFMVDGEYKFNVTKLKQAHDACFEKARIALGEGKSVVVANTFTRHWEYQRYLSLCDDVTVIIAAGRFHNIHGVPSSVVNDMRSRFEL